MAETCKRLSAYVYKKVKIKLALEQTTISQRGIRDIAILFL
jgi:hypothetical protein